MYEEEFWWRSAMVQPHDNSENVSSNQDQEEMSPEKLWEAMEIGFDEAFNPDEFDPSMKE